MIDRLALVLLGAGCMVFGAIFLVELDPAGTEAAAVTQVATRPDTAPSIRRTQNPRLDELVVTTLARPLFSNTRRPPSAPTEAATDSDLADARLTGIVTEPGRRVAIFAISGGDKPLKAIEGDSVSGWRIETITPREVSLTGPSGNKTLQPRFDPNLAPAPGQPLAGNAGGGVPTPPAAAARLPVPPAVAGVGQPNPAAPLNARGTPPRPPRARQQR
jgi:hypothetical protein